MVVEGKLHGAKASFRTQKVLIAAQYAGAKLTLDSLFKPGETEHSSEFLKLSPFGKAPVFEAKDGLVLWDENAIAAYVAGNISGSDAVSKAKVQEWVSFADKDLYPAAAAWVYPSLSVAAFNKQAVDQAKHKLLTLLKALDAYLLIHTYLVGERIGLADISVAVTLLLPFEYVVEPSLRAELINVTRWFNTLIHQPQFVAVLGTVSLCEKAAEHDAKKFKDHQSAAPHPVADCKQKPAKDSTKQDAPKEKAAGGKDKKAKAAEEPEEEMDAADEALALESKKKDPFDDFPKGTFNMDDFKRFYSNNDTVKSIPYFWEHFDKANFSIWFCEYKFPKELTMGYMSCNLISGMFQRLDKMRKNAFGSMCLFGVDNNSTISGIWIWRTHELAFKLSDDWQTDYESYEWKKLDADAPETKKMVQEYLAWEGDFGGKKFNQGKIFK